MASIRLEMALRHHPLPHHGGQAAEQAVGRAQAGPARVGQQVGAGMALEQRVEQGGARGVAQVHAGLGGK